MSVRVVSYREKIERNLYKNAVGFLVTAGMVVQSASRRILKVGSGPSDPGGRASGQLAGSIDQDIDPNNLLLRVGAQKSYARFVEGVVEGAIRPGATKRYFVPFRVGYLFEAWARRRGIKTTNKQGQVSGGIWVWGYRIPFIENGWKNSLSWIRSHVRMIHP